MSYNKNYNNNNNNKNKYNQFRQPKQDIFVKKMYLSINIVIKLKRLKKKDLQELQKIGLTMKNSTKILKLISNRKETKIITSIHIPVSIFMKR
jgi:hypothetical protein